MDAHKNLGIRSAVAVLLLTPLAHNCEILTCHAAAARASPDVLVEIGAVLAKWLNVVASLSAIFGGIGSGPACVDLYVAAKGVKSRSRGSPADFGKLIAAETEKWGKVVKFAGMKPE